MQEPLVGGNSLPPQTFSSPPKQADVRYNTKRQQVHAGDAGLRNDTSTHPDSLKRLLQW